MPNAENSLKAKEKGSAFFDLLASADEIKIRELTQEDVAEHFSETNPHERYFIVKVRSENRERTPKEKVNLDNHSRESLLRSASLLLQEKDFVLARNIYSYLAKRDPQDQAAFLGLGICLVKLNEIAPAIKCLQSLESTVFASRVQFWLGCAQLTTQNDAKAFEYFERIKEPESLLRWERYELYKEMGNCKLRMKDVESAWFYYHKALELEPSSAVLYTNLGFLEMQRANSRNSELYFRRAVELEPGNAKASNGLGILYLSQGKMEESKAAFERALTCDPTNISAIHHLIQFAHEPPDFINLEVQLRSAVEKDPANLELCYQLAVILFRQQHWSECDSFLNIILSQRPEHAKALKLKEDVKLQMAVPNDKDIQAA